MSFKIANFTYQLRSRATYTITLRLQIMLAQIQYEGESFAIDFSKPIDISLSLRGDAKNPIAWYLDSPKITPFKDGDFVGKVSEGASVNFHGSF